ncbi:radial spoke head 14 homolog isoform X3 [Capricornis sumatraensis]|uniref:radial spoke head 14 homolog isoform X3 n=1 Tax=Capricornis sumatraensis TaxID=34865 RepID=UPI00360486A4
MEGGFVVFAARASRVRAHQGSWQSCHRTFALEGRFQGELICGPRSQEPLVPVLKKTQARTEMSVRPRPPVRAVRLRAPGALGIVNSGLIPSLVWKLQREEEEIQALLLDTLAACLTEDATEALASRAVPFLKEKLLSANSGIRSKAARTLIAVSLCPAQCPPGGQGPGVAARRHPHPGAPAEGQGRGGAGQRGGGAHERRGDHRREVCGPRRGGHPAAAAAAALVSEQGAPERHQGPHHAGRGARGPQAPAVPRGHLPGTRGGPQPGRAAGSADRHQSHRVEALSLLPHPWPRDSTPE